MKKFLIILGIGVAALACVAFAGLLWIGLVSPETYIYAGSKIPARYIEKAKEFGIVEEGETVEYLYSDAFFKLEEGVFVFTSNHIGLHSTFWEFESVVVPYETIVSLHIEFDDSWFGGSMITVIAGEDVEYFFPLSNEKGRDRKVVAMIERKSGVKATTSTYEK